MIHYNTQKSALGVEKQLGTTPLTYRHSLSVFEMHCEAVGVYNVQLVQSEVQDKPDKHHSLPVKTVNFKAERHLFLVIKAHNWG